jgi:uracil-DNA glycosylase
MLLTKLLEEVRACTACKALPLGPRPVLAAGPSASILIVGQAPGTRVHATGIPWNDPSGDRLRDWMNIDKNTFYDTREIAIVPMGFCYPGRGKGGDLPPRPECAPLWHGRILAALPHIRLTILAGSYAQDHYLAARRKRTLTETVRASATFGNEIIPLPHPSPRNNLWLRKNQWFEREMIPRLRSRVREVLSR